uniref:Uncharacterized protein n=1 Tax=Rhizophora mucronata TaxID=61149 RepID=A0A2P2JZ63_RHIMU
MRTKLLQFLYINIYIVFLCFVGFEIPFVYYKYSLWSGLFVTR